VADVISAELERTLEAHEILSRLERASYGQEYTYTVPESGEAYALPDAYQTLVRRVGQNFRHICRQATMYELVRPDRSVHNRLVNVESQLALPDNDRLLDGILSGPEAVRQQIAATQAQAAAQTETPPAAVAEAVQEDEFTINILDEPAGPAFDISFPAEDGYDNGSATSQSLETSYADKLDNIAVKTNQIFTEVVNDLFRDDTLLPRLRRLFWLEATKVERDLNNHIIKPMLRNHDRKLYDEELRQAMEVDLESVSDLEELMRVWEGLHRLETEVV